VIQLKPGDIFLGESPWALGRIINSVQAFWSKDGSAKYAHAGLIISHDGATLEALWKVRSRNVFDAYSGRKILIGRNKTLDLADHWRGLGNIHDKKGDLYPLHRLLFFLFPPLAREMNLFGWTVCSELVGQYLYYAGKLDYWSGLNPDDLEEVIRNWKNWQVIFEGELP
jgi:hypothetical protein